MDRSGAMDSESRSTGDFVGGGITAAKGFRAAGVSAAIKYADRKDFALVVADVPAGRRRLS